MGILSLVFLGILAVLIFWCISIYNGMVRLRNSVQQSWGDVDVVLKKRSDLIPNLVETVKGYAKHETETFDKVVQARSRATAAQSQPDRMEAESLLSGALGRLLVVAEAYPELKATENFRQLQEQLSQVESQISDARRYYNAVVRDYNTRQDVFPDVIIASLFRFERSAFFEATDTERTVPQVKF